MSLPRSPSAVPFLTLANGAAGTYVLVGGLASFLGWALDVPRLTQWEGNGISIQPNAALSAMLTGAALLLLGAGHRRSTRILGTLVALLGAATLFEHLSGVNLGVDTLLMFERPWGRSEMVAPGRMGPPASTAWTLAGVALVLAGGSERLRRFVPTLGLLVCSVSALSLIGYLFGADALYTVPWLTAVASQTATFLLAAGAGLLMSVPERDPVRTLLAEGGAGVMARRALPLVVLLPIVLGYLRLRGQDAGLYDNAMGAALLVVALIAVLSAVLWRAIGAAGRAQDRLREASHSQEVLSEVSRLLADTLDVRTSLERTAGLAVGSLCDWCVIALGDESGRVTELFTAHRSPERLREVDEYVAMNPLRPDQPFGVPHVLRTGVSELLAEVSRPLLISAGRSDATLEAAERLEPRSAMIVPMIARGRTIGAISFVASQSGRRYTPEDLSLAERLAERAALATDNARLYEEARRAESHATEANRMKTEFLATISHELRTPLNAIVGYTQLLELGVTGPVTDQQREIVARLARSERHLRTLIEDVLGFAKLELGRIEFRSEDVSLNEALTSLGEMIHSQVAIKELTYEYAGCDPLLTVRSDRERLQQIVLNLLGNAVKFTPSGGRILMSVEVEQTRVGIHVRDNGMGIPPEKLEAIFEPFVQLASGLEPRPSGTGLGLSISRDLARALDGDLTVVSEPGAGTVFTVWLPRAPVRRVPEVIGDHRAVSRRPE